MDEELFEKTVFDEVHEMDLYELADFFHETFPDACPPDSEDSCGNCCPNCWIEYLKRRIDD